MIEMSSLSLLRGSLKFINENFIKILIFIILAYFPIYILEYLLGLIPNYKIKLLFGVYTNRTIFILFKVFLQILITKYFIKKNDDEENKLNNGIFSNYIVYLPIAIISFIIFFIPNLIGIYGFGSGISTVVRFILSSISLVILIISYFVIQEIVYYDYNLKKAIRKSLEDFKFRWETVLIYMIITGLISFLLSLPINYLDGALKLSIMTSVSVGKIVKDVLMFLVFSIIQGFLISTIECGKCIYIKEIRNYKRKNHITNG